MRRVLPHCVCAAPLMEAAHIARVLQVRGAFKKRVQLIKLHQEEAHAEAARRRELARYKLRASFKKTLSVVRLGKMNANSSPTSGAQIVARAPLPRLRSYANLPERKPNPVDKGAMYERQAPPVSRELTSEVIPAKLEASVAAVMGATEHAAASRYAAAPLAPLGLMATPPQLAGPCDASMERPARLLAPRNLEEQSKWRVPVRVVGLASSVSSSGLRPFPSRQGHLAPMRQRVAPVPQADDT